MVLFLKTALIACLTLITGLLCYRLLKRNLLYNHKLLAIVAKRFYNTFYSVKKISHLRVNNYGYAPIDEEIARFEPDLQHGLQMYKELVKNHNGYLIHPTQSLVEVGCGKGAGAEYLIEKFRPEKYTGIDYSKTAIDFCNAEYNQIYNANFICADAHLLPFGENSTDVVINVESSHIYRDLEKFFKEVHRILRTRGRFLFADYRYIKKCPVDLLEEKITNNGFSITERRVITTHVYDACMQASDRREKMIEEGSPPLLKWMLKKYFAHYAMLKGTRKSMMLGNGEIVYFIYHLEKN